VLVVNGYVPDLDPVDGAGDDDFLLEKGVGFELARNKDAALGVEVYATGAVRQKPDQVSGIAAGNKGRVKF